MGFNLLLVFTLFLHFIGCNSISWAPYTALGSTSPDGTTHILRLVTGSCDNTVRIWKFDGQWDSNTMAAGEWVEEKKLGGGHSGE
jgi:WD40 repeat protein